MLNHVIYAFTKTSDVTFEFVTRKSNIFRRSFGFEHHFLIQRKYFYGRPGELFFRHPVRRKQTYYYFWPHQKIKVERQFASVSEDTPLLCFHPLQQARSHQRSRFHRAT